METIKELQRALFISSATPRRSSNLPTIRRSHPAASTCTCRDRPASRHAALVDAQNTLLAKAAEKICALRRLFWPAGLTQLSMMVDRVQAQKAMGLSLSDVYTAIRTMLAPARQFIPFNQPRNA